MWPKWGLPVMDSGDKWGENGGFKPPWVKESRLHPEGLGFIAWRWRRGFGDCRRGRHHHKGPCSRVFGCTDAWGNHVWVPQLSNSPSNSGLKIFILACESEWSRSLTTKACIKGNCNESGSSYTGLWTREFHPRQEKKNPAPIRNKTQRITWVCFIRGKLCAHMGECVFSSLFRDPDRTDALKEKENLERGRKRAPEAQMSSFCAEARWQIAGAGRWKQEKTTDLLYSTLLQEMDSTPLFYFLCFSSSVPVSEWCIRVRRGWVLEGSERPGAHSPRGWDAWGGRRRIWWKNEERMSKNTKNWAVSACIFSLSVFGWCRGMEYVSNTQVKWVKSVSKSPTYRRATPQDITTPDPPALIWIHLHTPSHHFA